MGRWNSGDGEIDVRYNWPEWRMCFLPLTLQAINDDLGCRWSQPLMLIKKKNLKVTSRKK